MILSFLLPLAAMSFRFQPRHDAISPLFSIFIVAIFPSCRHAAAADIRQPFPSPPLRFSDAATTLR